MAKIIKGNHDGEKGGNETYNIPGRSKGISRKIIVEEIKKGKHPEHIVTKIDGKEYAKSKPNCNVKDNVNS